MSKEYKIAVTVDLSQSDAQLARQNQGLQGVATQAKRTGDAQEQAAKKAAQAQVQAFKAATDAGFVSFFKLDAQATKLSDKLASQAKRTADTQAREAARAADQRIKEDRRAFDANLASILRADKEATRLADKLANQAVKTAAKQTSEAQRATAQKVKEDERAFNASFVSSLKLDAQASKLSDKLASQAKKSADTQARESAKAADQKIKEDQRAFNASFVSSLKLENQASKLSDKLADTATRTANKQAAESQRAADKLTAMRGRSLTDEEVTAKGLGAVAQRLNDRRVSLATKTAEKERWAAMTVRDKFAEVGESIATKVNPGMLALGAATAVVGVGVKLIADHWKDVAKGITDSIKLTTDYRESLPENAALNGRLGDTTREALASLKLRTETLQTRDEEKGFTGGILNSGQVSVGSRITQKEFDRLKVQAGSFQSAEGGDPKTHGELVGQLPALIPLKKDATGADIPLTADQVTAKESKIFDILQLGKSSFSSGAKQLSENASLTQTGSFRSIEEQAALQSAFSLYGPDEAGTKTRWLEQATVGNIDRNRKSSIEGSEQVGQYLKTLGVQEGQKGIPIARLVSGDLTKQEDAAKATGRDFNASEYLAKKGYANQEHTRALKEFHGLDRDGQLQQFFDRANSPDDSSTIQDKIAAGRADPRMQERSAGLTSELQKFTYDRSHATAEAYRRQVFEELKSNPNGGLAGDYKDIATDSTQRKQIMLQRGVERALQRDARKAGVKVPSLGVYNPTSSQLDLDSPIQAAIDQLQKAKVDPFRESRQAVAGLAVKNLRTTIGAEAAPRAGLARGAEQERMRRQVPPMIARPGAIDPGIGGAPGADPVQALLQQLIGLTQQGVVLQTEADKRRAEANRLAQAGQNRPPVATPLPVMGPGRIPMRP